MHVDRDLWKIRRIRNCLGRRGRTDRICVVRISRRSIRDPTQTTFRRIPGLDTKERENKADPRVNVDIDHTGVVPHSCMDNHEIDSHSCCINSSCDWSQQCVVPLCRYNLRFAYSIVSNDQTGPDLAEQLASL